MNGSLFDRTVVDWGALSDDLLVRAKAESRVYHTRDDDLIKAKVQAALDMIERGANINLAPATYEAHGLSPRVYFGVPCCWIAQFQAHGVLLPFNNVREVRLFDDADVDITGDWAVRQREFGSNRDAYLVSPTQTQFPSAARVEIDVGCDDVADIAPFVLQVVLRIAASLYEFREADQALTEASFRGELMSIWRPTA